MIIYCNKGLDSRLRTEGCDECKCPTGESTSCKGSCKRNLNCEECLEAFFYGDDEQRNKRYECIPVTYTYVLKYLNRYASEIYRIFLQKPEMIQKLNNSTIFSLGCGPATELVAIDELIKVKNIVNVTYCGYDLNSIWRRSHLISSHQQDNGELQFSFKEELIKKETEGINNIDFLFLNYVCSDVYVHEQSNNESLSEWLENNITPLVFEMKHGASIIINDVNSPKMGRYDIQEWAWKLKGKGVVSADFFTFEKLMPSKIYDGQMYELKFDQKVSSKTIKEKDLIFQNAYSIMESSHCSFSSLPTECGSCFVILTIN